ncbi:MAG: hypothetical protein RR620_03280 [Clostridium sp.]
MHKIKVNSIEIAIIPTVKFLISKKLSPHVSIFLLESSKIYPIIEAKADRIVIILLTVSTFPTKIDTFSDIKHIMQSMNINFVLR